MRKIFNRHSPLAFSLVEVTIALGVAGFCLLAILGLLQTGLMSDRATVGQTTASSVLSAVFSDLVSTPATASSTQTFQIALDTPAPSPQTIFFSEGCHPTGDIGTPPTAESRYRVSIGVSSTTVPTVVRLLATWPAAADPDPNQWPTKASGSVEVVTALDRN